MFLPQPEYVVPSWFGFGILFVSLICPFVQAEVCCLIWVQEGHRGQEARKRSSAWKLSARETEPDISGKHRPPKLRTHLISQIKNWRIENDSSWFSIDDIEYCFSWTNFKLAKRNGKDDSNAATSSAAHGRSSTARRPWMSARPCVFHRCWGHLRHWLAAIPPPPAMFLHTAGERDTHTESAATLQVHSPQARRSSTRWGRTIQVNCLLWCSFMHGP